jgi:hypothetical protein
MIAHVVAQKRFRHLAAAGISGAKEQYFIFRHDHLTGISSQDNDIPARLASIYYEVNVRLTNPYKIKLNR